MGFSTGLRWDLVQFISNTISNHNSSSNGIPANGLSQIKRHFHPFIVVLPSVVDTGHDE